MVDDMSFSSDTGMAECLVIARKLAKGESLDNQGIFTSLRRRPNGFGYSSSLASRLADGNQARRLEDGPYGGITLMVGEELSGETITAPF